MTIRKLELLFIKKKKSITITKEKGQKLLQVYKFHFNI